MKICHFISVHPYRDTRILLKECSTLAAEGYEVHLVAPDAPENEIENGVFLHSSPRSEGGRLTRMTKTMWNVFQKAKSLNADIYHFHDPELIPAALLLRRSGKKVIYDVHEDVPRDILTKSWIPAPLRMLISKSFEVLENYASKKMSYIITATPFIKMRFQRLVPHVEVVNNYPILHELEVPEIDLQQKESAVTYVGSITKIRGITEMVEAAGKTDAKLLLGGKFSPQELREEIIKLAGWSQVEELGQLDRKTVAETFARAMAGLILLHPAPNHIDAQPNKMFEYMSAKLPLIGSDFPLWKEIIEGNSCGLCVDPLSKDDIAQAIQYILDHPEEANAMGENGYQAVLNKYNWEVESKVLISVYKELEA
ncbi:MAG: glycosyl transferase [Gracilibacter sp. BRH_c7a]|nr:MAG: glycosyl transferase [Gracilibacter sp. BRH_c7a]